MRKEINFYSLLLLSLLKYTEKLKVDQMPPPKKKRTVAIILAGVWLPHSRKLVTGPYH